MKTPSTDLFRLIKSMSSAEKRYFKKDTSNSNTSELFDIINDLDEYDEEIVKKKIKDPSFAKNLKVHKNRLQAILLKNLRSYHEEKSVQSKIKVLIDNGEILLRKQLYDLSHAQFEKALKYCEQYEEYELMLQVLGIQARMASYFKDMLPAEETPMVEMEKCAVIIQNYVQHALLNKEILHFLSIGATDVRAGNVYLHIKKLIDKEVVDKEREPLSPVAERMYLHSQALMYNAKGDVRKAHEKTKMILERYDSNKYIKKERNNQYFNAIVNHLIFCARLNAIKEVEHWVKKASKHASKHEHLMPNMIYVYHTFIEALRFSKQFSKIKAFIETDFEDLVKKYELEDQYVVKKTMALSIEAYFALEELSRAGSVILNILNNKRGLPKDLLYAVYMLELIYHFEQGDYMLIENMVAAHQKRIRRNNEDLPFFESVISFFKKISTTGVFEQKNHLQLHKTSLPKFEEDPLFFQLNLVFNYPVWIESKIRKIPYADLLKQREERRFQS